MFYLLFVVMSGWTLNLCQSLGPREGLWRGWLVGIMLPPVWLMAAFLSTTFDIRLGAALAGLAMFVLSPPRGPNQRFLLSDAIVALVVIGQIASASNAGDLRPMTSVEMSRKWLVPYLVGRVFLGSTADVARVARVFCVPALVMSLLAVFEALARINLVNKLFGKTYGLLEMGEGYRMGMKRAQGPMDHPIFFGMMLVLLLPWAMEAARAALRPGGRRWWLAVPWLVGAALFCTVLRGPQVGSLVMLFVVLCILKPQWRLALLVFALVAGGGGYSAKKAVMEAMGKVAGEEEEKRILNIDGDDHEYSGTAHRMLLWKVYAPYIRTAGFFGFGIKLKGVVIEDERLAELFASIDNGYLLMYLQYGFVGLGGFLALNLCSVVYLARFAWARGDGSLLAAGLCGALLGLSLTMLSVWFAPDYAAVWCFSTGIAANLRLLTDAPPEKPQPQLRRLHPGHAPLRPALESATG